ncbi:LysR substrate-binding domain-containing protein [Paraburkholderia sp. MM5482-R1]|uniref:LysR substrate-binding domain-containing protein n=1 Tax=unclassified Paraburkholderia TaxID=2615204 RepID=UPI003D22511B
MRAGLELDERVPTLLNKLRTTAPNARVQISHISAETPQLLAKGELELAVGFMPQLEAGFYQQKFFAQRYVVLASSNRGRGRARMTLKSYLDAHPSMRRGLMSSSIGMHGTIMTRRIAGRGHFSPSFSSTAPAGDALLGDIGTICLTSCYYSLTA